MGGTDASGPQSQLYWAIPTTDGNIPEWMHLDASDLGAGGLAGAAPVILGPDAVLVGGHDLDRRARVEPSARTPRRSRRSSRWASSG